MPNIQDLIPVPPAAPQPQEKPEGSLFGAAVSSEWITSWAMRQFARDAKSHDPWWELTESKLQELGRDLPAEYLPEFANADSEAEAQLIREQLLKVYESRQRLASAGWVGNVLQIGASIVDPVAIAATIATGGVGGEAIYAGKAARLARAASTGLAVGVPNAGLESIRANIDPDSGTAQVLAAGASGFGFGVASDLTANLGRGTRFVAGGAGQAAPMVAIEGGLAVVDDNRSAADVLYAGAISFLMGGAMNAIHANVAEFEAAKNLKRAIELDDVQQSGAPLTPKGEEYFKPVSDAAAAQALERRLELSEVADIPGVSSDETPAAPAAPAAARPSRRWTKTEIEQKLIDRYREMAQTLGESRADQDFDTGSFTTTFYKRIPSEIKDQFTRQEIARMFRVSDDRKLATAEDVAVDMGWDAYMAEVRRRSAGRDAVIGDAKKFFRDNPIDPELEFLAALHDQLPKGKLREMETVAPTDLPAGSEFTIKGEKFRIEVEGEGDSSILVVRDGEKYPTVPVAALDTIPVDKGSISEAKGSPEPYRGEFKPTPGQQRGLLGEQYDGGITGEQTSLGFARPSQFADEAAARPAPHASEENTGQMFGTEDYMADDPTYPGPQSIVTLSDEAFDAAIAGFNDFGDAPAGDAPDSPPIVGMGAASAAAMKAGLYQKASNRYPSIPSDFNARVHTATRAFNKRIGQAAGKVGVWLRNSISGLNGQSESSMVRRLTAQLVEDPLAKADGSPSRQSASEWARRNYEVDLVRFLTANRSDFEAWVKSKGGSTTVLRPLHRRKLLLEFNELAGRAARRDPGTFTNDPHVNAAAERWRKHTEALWYLQNRHGVAGFDQLQPYHNYFTRLWSMTKINNAIREHGYAAVEDLVAEAMDNKMGIGIAKTRIYAKGLLNTVKEARLGTDLDRARIFDSSDEATVRAIIKKAVPNITNDELNDVLYRTTFDPKTGLPSRARQRVSLDETHSMTSLYGKKALSIEDLLENDIEKIYARYSHDAHGQSAVAAVIESHRTGDTDTLNNYKDLLARVRRDAEQAYGVQTKDRQLKVDAEVARLEVAFKSILGHRIGSDSRLAEAGKLLRTFNYLRVMGRAGFNEAQDLWSAVAEAGVGTMLRSIPALAKIITEGRAGKMSDPLLREIEAFWAAGTDHFRGSVAHYLDPDAQIHVFGPHFDNAARNGGRVMNVANLMAPIASFNQKAIAIFAEQKWLDIARSGKLPSARRLADMGLDTTQAAAIAAEMKKHATTEPGLFGKKIVAANINLWDPDVAATYVGAVDRFTRSAVIRNDIGQLSRWMTTDMGKIIIQFRSYNITAYEKNLLRNGRARDFQTARAWSIATLAGALFYTANEYINSLGRADADEYRDEKLAPDRIARAAFQRASYSTFLPGLIDTGLAPFGTALFDTRTSGLQSNFITGNPSADTILDADAAIRGAVRWTRPDYQYSRTDFRAMRSILPFQNVLGLKNVLDAIETRLPEQSRLE